MVQIKSFESLEKIINMLENKNCTYQVGIRKTDIEGFMSGKDEDKRTMIKLVIFSSLGVFYFEKVVDKQLANITDFIEKLDVIDLDISEVKPTLKI